MNFLLQNYKIEAVTIPSILGMAPHYDKASGSIYFTDVFGIAVKNYVIDTGAFYSAQIINTAALELVSDSCAPP